MLNTKTPIIKCWKSFSKPCPNMGRNNWDEDRNLKCYFSHREWSQLLFWKGNFTMPCAKLYTFGYGWQVIIDKLTGWRRLRKATILKLWICCHCLPIWKRLQNRFYFPPICLGALLNHVVLSPEKWLWLHLSPVSWQHVPQCSLGTFKTGFDLVQFSFSLQM